MAQPWGAAIGPLNLGANLNPLPKNARENLPRFNGDGKTSPEEHLCAFAAACSVLGVQHQDVAIRLFVQTLTDTAAQWFYHLTDASITNWNEMKIAFENRFKSAEDEHYLLAQLTQLKKEIHEPMREFVAKFNRIVNKITATKRPSGENQKCFFINAMPPDISFHLRRGAIADLTAAQNLAVGLEDDLIMAGKWKREVQVPNAQSSSSTDPIVQRLVNDMIALKRQLPKAGAPFQQPYQDMSRRNLNQQANTGRTLPLTAAQPRLAIEPAPGRGNMCIFSLDY